MTHATPEAPAGQAAPWPGSRRPTPDEWREWYLQLDPPAQYDVAALVLASYSRGWSDALSALLVELDKT